MELKQAKPIHLRCPKCGYDFSYNTNHIEEEVNRQINRVTKPEKPRKYATFRAFTN